jgi:hypothetical protein
VSACRPGQLAEAAAVRGLDRGDSVDGTYLVFAPDHNLVTLQHWLLVVNGPPVTPTTNEPPAFQLAA